MPLSFHSAQLAAIHQEPLSPLRVFAVLLAVFAHPVKTVVVVALYPFPLHRGPGSRARRRSKQQGWA